MARAPRRTTLHYVQMQPPVSRLRFTLLDDIRMEQHDTCVMCADSPFILCVCNRHTHIHFPIIIIIQLFGIVSDVVGGSRVDNKHRDCKNPAPSIEHRIFPNINFDVRLAGQIDSGLWARVRCCLTPPSTDAAAVADTFHTQYYTRNCRVESSPLSPSPSPSPPPLTV